MKRFAKCGASRATCERARTGAIASNDDWACPCNNPDCEALREPVPWLEAMWILHRKKILIAGGAALILLLIGIIALLTRTAPLQNECEGIRTELDVLETRLVKLESQPTSAGAASPEATLKQLEQKAAAIHAGILSKLALKTEDGLKAAKDDLPTFDLHLKQGQTAAQTANKPAVGSGPVVIEAKRLIPDLEEIRSRAESLRNEAQDASNDTISSQVDEILESISKDLKRASKLFPKASAPNPPDMLTKFEARIAAMRSDATKKIAEFVLPARPVVKPFDEKDATLVIASSSDLPESLVIPLLKARSGGDAVLVQARWYYQSKTDFNPVEKIIIKPNEGTPYGDLISGNADLVVADESPSLAELTAFEKKFPGASLGSRAHSEVIALDAITLLAHPEGPRDKIEGKEASSLEWIGGLVGSPEHTAVLRSGFRPSRSAERPADAVLADKALLGLGLYHREGANIKAKRLAYQPAPETRELKPSPFSIATEDYDLSFRIQASTSPNSRKGALELVNHITSDKGQEIVANQGYVDRRLRPTGRVILDPLRRGALEGALNRQNIKEAIRISTNFRFETGKSELDLKAKADMEILPVAIAREFPKAEVVVLGFTDNIGPVEKDPELSMQRAKRITDELNKSKLPAKPAWLGRQLPVGDNSTEEGRASNRRSEVWVVPE